MKKIRLVLNESLVTNINTNQVDLIEDVAVQQKPDYQIIDITVIPDEEYNPTIQSILIDLDESSRLCESEEESKNLSINILSETVNIKTGYSNSLFEFENANHTITLSLVLQETDRRGIYKVEAYTTKGEKVFESNTYKPKKLIESYLNSLANEYLIDKKLNETDIIKEDAIDDVRADTAMNGVAYDDYMTNFGNHEDYYDDEEEKDYSVEEFMQANKLTDEVKSLNIDYSEWNNMNQEERDKLVTPELNRFYNKYKVEFDKNPKLFELLQYNLTDDNFHTEAKILRDLRGGE